MDEVGRPATFTLMAPGWWPPTHLVTQAYGWCLTLDGLVVLVAIADGFWNLPGGQVEPGEHPADTLAREVAEEGCARVTASCYLACQHVWDPLTPAGPTSHYQSRWWARVELEPWQPVHETVSRRVVPPARALAALSWRRKQIAGRLLDLALTTEDVHRQ